MTAGTLLVAHGTRNPAGVSMIGDLAQLMSRQLRHPVRVAFVDVLGPSPSQVLTELPDDQHIAVVPAFLARGYHVRADIPGHLADAAHPRATVSRALGPSPVLAEVLAHRLAAAGYRPGDTVVLAAAGSSDARAVRDVESAAGDLQRCLGTQVRIGFAAPAADGSGYPAVAEVVAGLRTRGPGRIAVASYLLADGLFQRRLHDCGADVVAAPLGLHPRIVDLACARSRSTSPGLRAAAEWTPRLAASS
ncbi:sirohydrochlorin chelatase [Gordonia sp. VNK21]|uniref:sirohydrochlorin chelatase n=1 Tax=Gordonia sp. VNK21 TaxID=3382483 RepID=UPI0038D45D6B